MAVIVCTLRGGWNLPGMVETHGGVVADDRVLSAIAAAVIVGVAIECVFLKRLWNMCTWHEARLWLTFVIIRLIRSLI